MTTVELFHLGPPKTATTWVYYCLREHPQIATSPLDRIHYFDMHYARGEDWYHGQFTSGSKSRDAKLFDPTYSYICSPRAPERIAKYNPQAKLMLCLRNPVERAFSHYWHIKKQPGGDGLKFTDVLEHYNSYATWLEHGFVGIGLRRFMDFYPRAQIHIMRFEDLHRAAGEEFRRICDFCGIDSGFVPSSLHKKINVAGPKKTIAARGKNFLARTLLGQNSLNAARENSKLLQALSGKAEYQRGIPADIRQQVQDICEPEIRDIESLTGLDLSDWRRIDFEQEAA